MPAIVLLMTLRLVLLSFCIFTIGNAQNVESPKFGDGMVNFIGKDSTWSMKAGLQMQFLSESEWQEDAGNFKDAETSFLIRRARLNMEGFVYSPKLTYKIVLGFSNKDMSGASEYTSNAPRYILDAVMKWNFYKNFQLWFGQTKLPGNREFGISSTSLQFVDRSLLSTNYNAGRDLGLQVRHHFNLSEKFVVKEAFAISQGDGRNVTSGNVGGFQYTSRLELLPLGEFSKKGDYVGGDLYRESLPKLAFGITYDFNDDAIRTGGNQGAYMVNDIGFHKTNISTLTVDAVFKYQGFSFLGEFAHRWAADPVSKNADGSLTGHEVNLGGGLNLQSGYVFDTNWEVSARYTNIDFDSGITGKDLQNQYTLGLSKYIVGHKLKVQTDISYLTNTISNDQLMWRLQFAIDF